MAHSTCSGLPRVKDKEAKHQRANSEKFWHHAGSQDNVADIAKLTTSVYLYPSSAGLAVCSTPHGAVWCKAQGSWKVGRETEWIG